MHDETNFAAQGLAGEFRHWLRCGLVVVAGSLCSQAMASFVVYEAAGATPADITATRDAFRSAVGGGSTPGANGDFGGLRREINWDDVPATFTDPNLLPGNFFNVNSPRGVVFTTPGSGFMVSANGGSSVPVLFGFPGDLQTFSAQKLFAPVGSNTFDISFFDPGTTAAATTSAFGAVFVDVEGPAATTMEFFDASGASLFSRSVLTGNNQELSFLGGVANAGEQIARVRITTPENFLKSNGVRDNEANDFVVMDDFLYATPSAIPVPGTLALGFLGLTALGWNRRRKG